MLIFYKSGKFDLWTSGLFFSFIFIFPRRHFRNYFLGFLFDIFTLDFQDYTLSLWLCCMIFAEDLRQGELPVIRLTSNTLSSSSLSLALSDFDWIHSLLDNIEIWLILIGGSRMSKREWYTVKNLGSSICLALFLELSGPVHNITQFVFFLNHA